MNLFDRSFSRTHKMLLGLILLGALLGRIVMAHYTYCVGTDSINFLEVAQRMAPLTREGIAAGIEHHPFHPGYSFLMALTHRLTGAPLDRSGQIVSILFGTLALVPMFVITRRLFGTVPGLCAAVLLGINPEHLENSADVMSEATFIFCVLFSVAASLHCWTNRSWWAGLWAGAGAAAAYLIRPEGGTPLLVLAVLLAIGSLRRRPGSVKSLAAALIAFTLLAAPYIAHISFIDGSFKPEVTMKKTFWPHPPRWSPEFVAAEATASEKKSGGSEGIFTKFRKEYVESIFYYTLGLVLIGVPISFVNRSRIGAGTGYLVVVMGLTVVTGLVLYQTVGYLSSRHIQTFTVLSMVWAGFAMAWSALWLHRVKLHRWMAPATTIVALTLFVVAVHLPKVAKPNRWDWLGTRSVAAHLRALPNFDVQTLILTNVSQPIYYAGFETSNMIPIQRSDRLDDVEIRRVVRASKGRARYLLVPYKKGFKRMIDSGGYDRLRLLYTYTQKEQEADFQITRTLPEKRRLYLYEIPEEIDGP